MKGFIILSLLIMLYLINRVLNCEIYYFAMYDYYKITINDVDVYELDCSVPFKAIVMLKIIEKSLSSFESFVNM